jgi:hypothetical protein
VSRVLPGVRHSYRRAQTGAARANPAVLVAMLLVACSSAPAATSPAASAGATGSVLPSVGSTASPDAAEPTPAESDGGSPEPTAPPPTAGGAIAGTWKELAPKPAGPGPREDHTWTVDTEGRYAYLFGGRNGGHVYGDLWRFDLQRDDWEALEPQRGGPRPRFGHTAVWVDEIGLVVWSGQTGSSFFADLWAYDPDSGAWRELPGAGARPQARYGSCAGIGPDGRMWISHGFTDEGRFDDTRAYDFDAGRWSDETPTGEKPIIRCLHDCLWTPDGRFLLYAGQTNADPYLADLWSLVPGGGETPTAWATLGEGAAPGRNLYALAMLPERALILGGVGDGGKRLDDLWTLSYADATFAPVAIEGALPGGRSGGTLIDDAARDRVLLFGGRDDAAALAETWQLELHD